MNPERAFERRLGFFDVAAMVAGTVIGSGIFLTTGVMAQNVASPGWLLAVWLAGAVVAATGAATFAQLAALRPEAGGAYIYLREAYGPGIGFTYGWALFLVMQSGSIAALAAGFAHYFGRFIPALSMEREHLNIGGWTLCGGHISAVAAIAVLTLLNIAGARLGSGAQKALAGIKIGALAALAVGGIFVAARTGSAAPLADASSWSPAPAAGAFGVALLAALWTYSGWWNINFAAGEVKNPSRNIPLGMAAGMAVVAILYLAVNWVYVCAVNVREIQGVVPVAERAAGILFGGWTAPLIAAAATLSILGALNGLIFTSPRAYFAMAGEGDFLNMAARLHPRFGTPHMFLVVQGVWSCVLALSGGYEALFTYVMFPGFIFTALACYALFILHKRAPEISVAMPALYPWAAIFHIAASLAIALATLWSRPTESLAGAALIGAGAFMYGFKKKAG